MNDKMKGRFRKRYIQHGILPDFNSQKQWGGGIQILWDRQNQEFVMAHHRVRSIHQPSTEDAISFGSSLALILTALVPGFALHYIRWGLHWYWFVIATILGGYAYIKSDAKPQDVTPVILDKRILDSYRYHVKFALYLGFMVISASAAALISKDYWWLVLVVYVLWYLFILFLGITTGGLLVHHHLIQKRRS